MHINRTLRAPADLSAPFRVAVDVRAFSDFGIQWTQASGAGTATAKVYGSELPINDSRLSDTDPSANDFWEEDTTLTWSAPGAVGASTARHSDNAWATILIEIDVTSGTLGGFGVFFFAKGRD